MNTVGVKLRSGEGFILLLAPGVEHAKLARGLAQPGATVRVAGLTAGVADLEVVLPEGLILRRSTNALRPALGGLCLGRYIGQELAMRFDTPAQAPLAELIKHPVQIYANIQRGSVRLIIHAPRNLNIVRREIEHRRRLANLSAG